MYFVISVIKNILFLFITYIFVYHFISIVVSYIFYLKLYCMGNSYVMLDSSG